MKVSLKTVFMVLAIVLSFVMVQAVWADVIGPYTVTGTVISGTSDGLVLADASIDPNKDSLFTEDGTLSVYGLGPASYWANYDVDGDGSAEWVAFPMTDDQVVIVAYEVDFDTTTKLVATEVTNITQRTKT